MIRFEQPMALLLAAAIIPLVIFGWRAMRGGDHWRTFFALALRSCAIAAISIVLAGPRIVRQHDHLTVIGLLDISGSMRFFADLPALDESQVRSNIEYLRAWFRNAADLKEPDDRFGLVVFDGATTVVSTPTSGRYTDDGVDVAMLEGTNIAEAIRLGAALLPADTARRMVLISDGNETSGRALEAAREASTSGELTVDAVDTSALSFPIDVVPIAYNVPGDVQVLRVETPQRARPEQKINVRIVLSATQPTTGRLTLTREGQPVDISPGERGASRRVELPRGESVFIVPTTLDNNPVHRFSAVFEPDDPTVDALTQNNSAESFTLTPGKGRVLIVDAQADARPGLLAGVLGDAGLPVDQRSPSAFPADFIDLQRYDLIVLNDVPAYAFDRDQQQALVRHVNDLGAGLIMMGGENSFGVGGWTGTDVEALLPVLLDPPKELRLPTAALVLVIDKSGSMSRGVAGARATQQEVANEGAAQAILSLRQDTMVGVVTFDSFASELVALQANDDPKRLANRVRSIKPDGGTRLGPALEKARRMLADVKVEKKRIVCLSDGQSGENLELLVQQMHMEGIRLSTIAVGNDADHEMLKKLSEIGDGVFYPVRDPRVLPRVLVDSVQVVNKPLIREGRFVPQVQPTGSTITASLASPRPLDGMVITADRGDPTVVTDLRHPDGEPLLARWQAGLGRVAAFTSDVEGLWSSQWTSWPGAETFLVQLARTVSRPENNLDYELSAVMRNEHMQLLLQFADSRDDQAQTATAYRTVAGTVYAPGGRSIPVRMRQTGPGRYEATVPAAESGQYIAALVARKSGEPPMALLGGATRAAGAEYRAHRSNIELMREIAQATGGRMLDVADAQRVNMFDRTGLPTSRSLLPIWRDLLPWLIVLLLIDIAGRRIAWSGAGVRHAYAQIVASIVAMRLRNRQAVVTTATLQQAQRSTRAPQPDRPFVVEQAKPQPSAAQTDDDLQPRGTHAIASLLDRVGTQPADEPVKRSRTADTTDETTSSQPHRAAPDKATVNKALDKLMGVGRRRGDDDDRDADADANTAEDRESDADANVGGLREAMRRARQRAHGDRSGG